MSERLFGRRLSAGEVSAANKKLLEPVEAWRNRSLADEKYVYLFLDGTNFSMRRGREVEKQCVLVVVGVTEDRRRQVLVLQAGDKESSKAWASVFEGLIRRGLDPSTVQLGVMDGLPGLEKAFQASFRRAAVQRCQLHKARNVLVKVRKKDRKAVADDMRQVFYAGDSLGAKRALERFRAKWRSIYPDAVRCLEKDFDALTAYLEFPELELRCDEDGGGLEERPVSELRLPKAQALRRLFHTLHLTRPSSLSALLLLTKMSPDRVSHGCPFVCRDVPRLLGPLLEISRLYRHWRLWEPALLTLCPPPTVFTKDLLLRGRASHWPHLVRSAQDLRRRSSRIRLSRLGPEVRKFLAAALLPASSPAMVIKCVDLGLAEHQENGIPIALVTASSLQSFCEQLPPNFIDLRLPVTAHQCSGDKLPSLV
jgi:hypothetical protein